MRSVVVDDVRALDRLDRLEDRRPSASGVARVDGDVAHACRSPTSTRSIAPIVPPASPIALATLPEHAGAVLDLDADGEAVLRGRRR